MTAGGNGRDAGFERLRRVLRGDGTLPIGEAMHPLTLAAVAVLVINDWVLKPRYGPSVITGKLSDVAGLVFAPVVLSAALGLALFIVAKLGAPVHPRLTERRLVACIVATGAGFAAVKLSATAASWFVALVSALGRPAEVSLDRTDLLCLPALAIALWIGRDEIKRSITSSANPTAVPPDGP